MTVGRPKFVAVFAALGFSIAGIASSVVVLNPTADSYVRDGSSANTNFGTATPLEVRTSSNGQNRDAHFKFDVSSVTGITLVKLRVNASLSGSGTLSTSAYSVPTTTWTETAITWNNKPALGTSLASVTVSGTSYAWYELNVTSYVQNEKAAGRNIVSFALHAANSTKQVSVKSKETATEKPELSVTGNAAPTVSITSPVNGATTPQPANITINATAADSDGTVNLVEFFEGANKIGEDLTSPYSFAWNDILAGPYSFTARATDNSGAVTTSTAVAVTVTEGGPTNVSGGYETNQTWQLSKSPYIVTGNVSFGSTSPTPPTLTIEAGVVVKFNAGTKLEIGYTWNGEQRASLQAVGTATRPITFTANTASPTAGYWQGILFSSNALPASRIAYGTVRYGGIAGNFGGVRISGSSPTIQNSTIRDNAHSGITCSGNAAPLIQDSTLTSNPIGLYVSKPAAPSLTNVTFSSNTGYAISMDANVTLGPVSGVTATGNGTNGAELRTTAMNVDINTTWKYLGIPYFAPNGVPVGQLPSPPPWTAPVLTIEPGVIVKFGPGKAMEVGYNYFGTTAPGVLQADGTATLPIVFTANTGSPTAGFWRGVQFYGSAASASHLSYATVSYAGLAGNVGGVHLSGAGPAILDHVRFDTNAYAGLSVNIAAPTVQNCDFVNNAAGLVNQTYTLTTVDARRNWWNAATGPAVGGFGTGQSVSGGVRFEPWLTAAASSPQFFSAFALGNTTFNPTLSILADFSFTTPASGNWTLTVFTSTDVLVRTISGSGSTVATSWDGKNDGGVAQPNGTYRYNLASAAGANAAAPLRGYATIDGARQLTVTGAAATPVFFSPNADSVQDSTSVSGTASFDGAAWAINVKNGGGTVVRSATGTAAPAVSFAWDGKNGSGVVQPDGAYSIELTVTDGTASVFNALPATLDVTVPAAAVTNPAGSETLSNVYSNGQADVTVTGTSSDTNLLNWTLDYGAGSNPGSWTTIVTSTLGVSTGTLGVWATTPLAGGLYTLRLRTFDKAGNTATVAKTPTVGNFTMSQNVLEFDRSTGGTVVYTSTVPFTLTETIALKNLAGQTVHTLLSSQRGSGTYTDSWNGRNAQANLLPDGPYFYVATVTDGVHSMTWDLTTQYVNDGFLYYDDAFAYIWELARFEPFNNKPMKLDYQFAGAGRSWILFTTSWGSIGNNGSGRTWMCATPGNFCIPNGEYQASGYYTLNWTGIDPSGVFRRDIEGVVLMVNRETFSKNAVVAFGTRPAITNFALVPSYYGGALGPQTISFTLTTFQSQPANAVLTVKNLASNSVLRTLTFNGIAPGAVNLTWDGRAENGMRVAPGWYTLDLVLTDGVGNTISEGALSVIDY